MFLIGNDVSRRDSLNTTLQRKFEMTCLGNVRKCIGIKFTSTKDGLYLHQVEFILKLLRVLGMHKSYPSPVPRGLGLHKSYPSPIPMQDHLKLSTETGTPLVDATTYRRIVGKLNFLTNARLDIQYTVNHIAMFVQALQEQHIQAIHQILHYLRQTSNYGIFYLRKGTFCSKALLMLIGPTTSKIEGLSQVYLQDFFFWGGGVSLDTIKTKP